MNSRLFIILTVIFFILAEGSRLPFELKIERRFSGVEIFPIDINQDKVDELLRIGKNNIQLFDQKGKFYWDFYFTPRVLKTVSVCDYDKDGLKELFLTHSDGLNEIVEYYRPAEKLEFIKRFTTVKDIDRNHDGIWDGGVTAISGIDANDDGKLDLLLNVGCSFDLQPRGLAAYDIETGKELWHYWIGPAVDNVILEDLNNDGKQEIVIGTYSTANGSEANNTSDTKSYVIVLNRKGKLLWQKQLGENFTLSQIAVLDLDQDTVKEIIAAQSTRKQGNEEPDKLVFLDSKDGREKRLIIIGENFYGLACVDIDHNGTNEIITGNTDGTIRIFDTNLEGITKYKNNTGINVLGITDLDGDGRNEIISGSADNKLIIFNEKLKEVVELKLNRNIIYSKFGESHGEIKPVSFYQTRKLLITEPKEYESDFTLYDFSSVPILKHPNLAILILFAIIIFFLIHFLSIRSLLTFTIRIAKKYYSKVNEIGYIIMNKKGKARIANPRAENLLGLQNLQNSNLLERLKKSGLEEIFNKLKNLRQFENTEITIHKGEEQEKVLSLNFYKMPMPGIFTLRIEDVTKYHHLARIESWAPVAQKLAHGIKTPLMNIQLGIHQLATNPKSAGVKPHKTFENINAEIDRLKKLVDNFMKFTQLSPPNLIPENINEILKDLVSRYYLSLPPEIRINLDLNDEVPKILIDKNEIENAFSIIIDNAVEAMAKTGILSIATSVFQRFEGKIKSWTQITIADTGKGIPEKYLRDVYTPYFVYEKPNGTGLGLPLAKRIIESHKGTIELNSKEGIGTTVIINLPVTS